MHSHSKVLSIVKTTTSLWLRIRLKAWISGLLGQIHFQVLRMRAETSRICTRPLKKQLRMRRISAIAKTRPKSTLVANRTKDFITIQTSQCVNKWWNDKILIHKNQTAKSAITKNLFNAVGVNAAVALSQQQSAYKNRMKERWGVSKKWKRAWLTSLTIKTSITIS